MKWEFGSTFQTHNHPTRRWETSIVNSHGQLLVTTHGETCEEAEALASLIIKAVQP